MARLFFAIWPDEPAARALAEAGEALAALAGGKPVPAAKIHLTLAFLGEVADERAEDARAAAQALRGRPFAMTLDRVGSFRAARVAWAGAARTSRQLGEIQESLAAALRARGFGLEERPFVAHATLARRIATAVPVAPMPPITWHADAMTLVRSETGTGRYAILERWVLG
jgi:2'-5' RNA ligase